MLSMIFIMYPRASVSATRINEVLDTVPTIKEGNFAQKTKTVGKVEFKNVSFKYPDGEEYVLKNISFVANKGDTVAFIGSTGSGKSTLVNLLLRFYDVTEGEILIDDINIKEYQLEELYNNEDVKVIICATGGEFLLEMLSFLYFSCVQENIKWLQGYSDPTGLLFTITTGYDIATIYGNNFAGFGMNTWHESLQHNFDLLEGNLEIQKSFSLYESGNTSPLEENRRVYVRYSC